MRRRKRRGVSTRCVSALALALVLAWVFMVTHLLSTEPTPAPTPEQPHTHAGRKRGTEHARWVRLKVTGGRRELSRTMDVRNEGLRRAPRQREVPQPFCRLTSRSTTGWHTSAPRACE